MDRKVNHRDEVGQPTGQQIYEWGRRRAPRVNLGRKQRGSQWRENRSCGLTEGTILALYVPSA